MRLLAITLLLYCPALWAACDCGSTNEASPCTGQTISQTVDGVAFTWGFTCGGGDCQCGVFREGSPWVRHASAGNVSINSVSPDDSTGGLQKNPGVISGSSTRENKNQGLLSGASEAPYVASLDISDELPYLAAADDGVYVKAEHHSGDCGADYGAASALCVDTYATLTVLNDFPPDNTLGTTTFRYGASGATKLRVTESDIDLTLWPRIASFTASTSYSGIATRWNPPYPDFFAGNNGDTGQRWKPFLRSYSTYAAARAVTHMTDMYGTMDTDTLTTAKEDAIYAMLQYGMELYSAFVAGTEWTGGAGQSVGRWLPIITFGAVYNGASKTTVQNNIRAATANVSTNTNGANISFVELYQIRPNNGGMPIWGSYPGADSCSEGGFGGHGRYWADYSRRTIRGLTSKGGGTCGDPYGWVDGAAEYPGGHYASTASTGPFITITNLLKIWPELEYVGNHPTMRRYAERVMNGGGWWVNGDLCSIHDTREPSTCAPYTESYLNAPSTNCDYFGDTWGYDITSGDGTCVTITEATARGHPSPRGRWQNITGAGGIGPNYHLQGRPPSSSFQYQTPGYALWDTLVPRTGNQISATGTITNDDP